MVSFARSAAGQIRTIASPTNRLTVALRIATPSAPALPRELLVLDPVRNGGIDAEAALLVFLVVLEVALEPLDMTVALEGEHVGRDAVEEPAVVTDDHGATGEVLQRLFQRAQ